MTATIEPTAIPHKSDDVLSTEAQDVTVLMSMETSKFIELNETAGEIWQLIDGSNSVDEIVGQLSGRFEVTPDNCRAQASALLSKMRDEGLIVFAD